MVRGNRARSLLGPFPVRAERASWSLGPRRRARPDVAPPAASWWRGSTGGLAPGEQRLTWGQEGIERAADQHRRPRPARALQGHRERPRTQPLKEEDAGPLPHTALRERRNHRQAPSQQLPRRHEELLAAASLRGADGQGTIAESQGRRYGHAPPAGCAAALNFGGQARRLVARH